MARPSESIGYEDLVPLMQLEAAHVWSLYERGIARDVWLRTDALGAVYVLEARVPEATRVLSGLPMVRAGLFEFEVIPVGPFTPLANLFGTQAQPVPPCALPAAARRRRSQRVLALDRPRPGVTRADISVHLNAEAEHAWGLWKAGVIRENYLRTDQPGALIVLEADGVTEAHAMLSTLPLVTHGLIDFECLSVGAFMGFDALLEGEIGD